MTVFTPDKNKYLRAFLLQFFALLIIAGFLYIYYYNVVAGNRFALNHLKSNIAAAEEQNAALKNTLYQVIDPTQLQKLAVSKNLVVDKNPQYLSTNQWVSDSSY